jgi:hypothetical protein
LAAEGVVVGLPGDQASVRGNQEIVATAGMPGNAASDGDDTAQTGFTLPIGCWIRNQRHDAREEAIQRLERTPVLPGAATRRTWDEFPVSLRSRHWSRLLTLVVLAQPIG